MRLSTVAMLLILAAVPSPAQVYEYADLNTRQIDNLDRSKTVLIIPGGILEQHGPYLPSGSDGIFNRRLANDLAAAIAARKGRAAVMLPPIPLGSGAANEIGRKYSFPGSVTVRPATLRAVFMDLADQLGGQRFRWILVIHGHGDPAHNRMLDEAGEYFHETYGGEMVNLFGYLWAMPLTDFRSTEERGRDGRAEHATMVETSVILALHPRLVSRDVKRALPQTGESLEDLERIAAAADWPGYFGDPALATAALGRKVYRQWLEKGQELVNRILAGDDYRTLPRLAELGADDPADAAAVAVNDQMEARQQRWLANRATEPRPPR